MPELSPSPYADPFAEGWKSWGDPGAGNPYDPESEDWEEWEDGRRMANNYHARSST